MSRYNNIITRTDSYKHSHFLQYPEGTKRIHSYVATRGSDEFDYSLFFGPQLFYPKLSEGFTRHDIDEAEEDVIAHGEPFNRAGWEYILNKHGGIPPVRISTIREGQLLPSKNCVATIENVDEDAKAFWMPGHLETDTLRSFWYPTTVATNSLYAKVEILKARMLSMDDPMDGLAFALHDFGGRGVSCGEQAEIGGSAHMVNFMGTDTFECLRPLRVCYGEKMAGFSIPAAEHSTVTSWRRGKITNEKEVYENMLRLFGKQGGIVAVVSDSYDLWNAIEHIWGGELREQVKTCGARVVIRPDSGDALTVPVRAVQMVAERFGYTVNNKGYKVLPPYVRVIQGDGVNRHSIRIILANLLAAGFSAENLVFGMGGALLQKGIDRDTMNWSMKASQILDANDVWWDVYKSPVDQPMKKSTGGRFAVIGNSYDTIRTVPLTEETANDNLLIPGWDCGKILNYSSLADIRGRANEAALWLAAA